MKIKIHTHHSLSDKKYRAYKLIKPRGKDIHKNREYISDIFTSKKELEEFITKYKKEMKRCGK
ncbi:MAG: hypothetical protein RR536_01725 [Anaerovoracaceae bacterium]